MRANRTSLIAVLAVLVGFVLAGGIFGCKTSSDKDAEPLVVAPPAAADHIAVPRSITTGQNLIWEPLADAKLGTLILTIPDKLCTPNHMDKHDTVYGVYIVKVTTQVTCTVIAQPHASGATITYYYKYQLLEPAPLISAPPQSNPATGNGIIELLDIAGSCAGCDVLKKGPPFRGSGLSSTLYEQVECIGKTPDDKPTVVDEDDNPVANITVPADTKRVTWRAQGDRVTIKFQSYQPTPPCTNLDNNGALKGYQCNVNDGARGKPSYDYTVSLSGCYNGKPSPTPYYKLTLK